MTEREALLRAVCADPDDDTPRLVFADWLQEHGEEPRAEFIRVQVRYAARFESGVRSEYDADVVTATQLEEEHGARWWLGRPPPREGVSFGMWRGFPFWLTAPDRRALGRAEHSAPGLGAVERLTLGTLTRGAIRYFAGRWYTPRVRVLELNALDVWPNVLGDLFSEADWSGLRYLSLRGCRLGYSGVSAVADCPALTGLRVLDLGHTQFANAGVAALCRSAHLTNLACLRVDGNEFLLSAGEDLRRCFGERAMF